MDNFFTEEELDTVWNELNWITNPSRLLPASVTGSPAHKTNHLSYVPEGLFQNKFCSDIVQICNNKILNNENLKDEFHKINPLHGSIKMVNNLDTIVKYYEGNQGYKAHRDYAIYSSMIFLHKEPKSYTGGDILFPELKTKIECINNRFILFGSGLSHEVSPLVMEDKTLINGKGRYSIVNFLTVKNDTKV